MYGNVRYAVRCLRRQPGFALTAILTLAVGIGATTAVFSVADAVLFRPLPFKDSERLMQLCHPLPAIHGMQPDRNSPWWSYPKYVTFREAQSAFDATAAYSTTRLRFTGGADPEIVPGEFAESAYFNVLGAPVQLGRTFLPEEDRDPGAHSVVVLSDGFWRRRAGADPGVAGRTILLEGRAYTVVGVLAPGFRGLSGRAEFWLPASMAGDRQLTVRFSHNWFAVGRRKPGVSVREAVAATAVAGAEVDRAHPDSHFHKSWGAHARPLSEVRAEPAARKAGWVFLAAVGFVLLVACANVVNLLLTRNTARRREMAIRQAVGAGRGRLMRQLLVETGVIAAAGGFLGVLMATMGVRLLASLDPAGENPLFQRLPGLTVSALSSISVNTRVLLFSLAAAMLACLVSGLMPALSALRTDLVDDLKAGIARRNRRAGFGWLAGSRAVVVAEVALAVILATGAGLLIRSFGRLLAIRTGVDAENLLTVGLDTRDLQGRRAEAFFEQLQTRVAAIPGVTAVAARDSYPLSGCCSITSIWFPDRPSAAADAAPLIGAYVVSPDYFRTARIPLLRGRLFSPADHETSPKVAVISESAARRFWPGENAIGKRIRTGDGLNEGGEVIGIVGDVRNRRFDEPEPPSVYTVSAQNPGRLGVLFVRTEREPTALAAAVRGVVRELDRNLVIRDIKTMRERISDAGSKARFGAGLLALFAAIAVALAAIGVYGVMSCSVAQSTREMGIRLALGADPASVAGLVLRRGATLVCAGLAIGIPAALALSRLLESLLYEVKPADPAAYAATAGVLALVALPACWMPARRAARIDATVALRAD